MKIYYTKNLLHYTHEAPGNEKLKVVGGIWSHDGPLPGQMQLSTEACAGDFLHVRDVIVSPLRWPYLFFIFTLYIGMWMIYMFKMSTTKQPSKVKKGKNKL